MLCIPEEHCAKAQNHRNLNVQPRTSCFLFLLLFFAPIIASTVRSVPRTPLPCGSDVASQKSVQQLAAGSKLNMMVLCHCEQGRKRGKDMVYRSDIHTHRTRCESRDEEATDCATAFPKVLTGYSTGTV